MTLPDIKIVLDSLSESRSSAQLANDPISFCHRYDDPRDQEIAAMVSSCFAYGAVGIILRSLEAIFAQVGPSPRRFVEEFNPGKGMDTFRGFKHRFNDGRDLCALFWALRLMVEHSGSVNDFFLLGHDLDALDVTDSLNSFSLAVRAMDYRPVFGPDGIAKDSYFPFLFPAPGSGSACKRLCMFLRWVVRPADGVDLGLWHGVSPSQLVIPVDTHIQRICSYLGLSRRKSADWRMACEITAGLRQFDPCDPVKYDFSLAHLGISQGCDGKDVSVCSSCRISGICPQNSSDKA